MLGTRHSGCSSWVIALDRAAALRASFASAYQAAIASVNNAKFGIHVGLFTTDLNKSIYAWENCDVGGVVVGDVPSMRVDAQPYGGVKDSGIGCES